MGSSRGCRAQGCGFGVAEEERGRWTGDKEKAEQMGDGNTGVGRRVAWRAEELWKKGLEPGAGGARKVLRGTGAAEKKSTSGQGLRVPETCFEYVCVGGGRSCFISIP